MINGWTKKIEELEKEIFELRVAKIAIDKIYEILAPMRGWTEIHIQERLDLLYDVLEVLRDYKGDK